MKTRIACLTLAVSGLVAVGCNKKDGDKGQTASDPGPGATEAGDPDTDGADDGSNNNNNPPANENEIAVAGTLALGLNLTSASAVTHVIALDADSGDTKVAEIVANKFTLALEKGANYVLTYVNEDATGSAMLVSTFGSGPLDTLATNDDSTNVSLGEVDPSTPKAGSSLDEAGVLTALGMTTDVAASYGAGDDVSLRYSNPDIDGNGEMDAVEGKKFILDFHNRFTVRKPDLSSSYAVADLKNTFPADDANLVFNGSGIIPWFEDSVYASTPGAYTWTLTADAELNDTCANVVGTTLTANTACELDIANGTQSVAGKPSIELKAAVNGTYVLNAGGKTFTWTNVKVSDFSGGEGFIALFYKVIVNDSDIVTGIGYRWRKNVGGIWTAVTKEELTPVVAGSGGYMGFRLDGDASKSLGLTVPLEPEGTLNFADLKAMAAGVEGGNLSLPTGMTEAEVKAGIDWSRFLGSSMNPGISYDDKLGMRFFF